MVIIIINPNILPNIARKLSIDKHFSWDFPPKYPSPKTICVDHLKLGTNMDSNFDNSRGIKTIHKIPSKTPELVDKNGT